jgi:hypothetical protein
MSFEMRLGDWHTTHNKVYNPFAFFCLFLFG